VFEIGCEGGWGGGVTPSGLMEKRFNNLPTHWRYQNLNRNDYYAKKRRGFNRNPISHPEA
jgi:hypothetical protein